MVDFAMGRPCVSDQAQRDRYRTGTVVNVEGVRLKVKALIGQDSEWRAHSIIKDHAERWVKSTHPNTHNDVYFIYCKLTGRYYACIKVK
jgi:hypothetical protein